MVVVYLLVHIVVIYKCIRTSRRTLCSLSGTAYGTWYTHYGRSTKIVVATTMIVVWQIHLHILYSANMTKYGDNNQ